MNEAVYTPEVMAQAGLIFDRLDHLPKDKRSIVAMMADAFINGMKTQEQMTAARSSG